MPIKFTKNAAHRPTNIRLIKNVNVAQQRMILYKSAESTMDGWVEKMRGGSSDVAKILYIYKHNKPDGTNTYYQFYYVVKMYNDFIKQDGGTDGVIEDCRCVYDRLIVKNDKYVFCKTRHFKLTNISKLKSMEIIRIDENNATADNCDNGMTPSQTVATITSPSKKSEIFKRPNGNGGAW